MELLPRNPNHESYMQGGIKIWKNPDEKKSQDTPHPQKL